MFYGVEQFRSRKCDSLSLGPGSVLGKKGKKQGKIGKIKASEASRAVAVSFFSPEPGFRLVICFWHCLSKRTYKS